MLAGFAWVFGNPPSGGPDELSHYVKALGVAGGDLDGRTPPQRAPRAEDLERLGALIREQGAAKAAPPNEAELRRQAWMKGQTREFTIPAALGVNTYCAPRGEARLACLGQLRVSREVPYARTPMGTYQPLPYVLPGLAARAAGDPTDAVRLARIASALICLALLGLAVAVLARGGREGLLSLLGLVVALSPAVLLTATTLNPSGPEVAGSICFIAGLLTVTRPDGRWWAAWTAVAAGGACLAASRSFGPLFVLLAVVFVAFLVGRTGLRAAVAFPRAPAVVAAGVVGAAAAWNVYWELTQQTHPGAGRSDIRPGITDAWEHLPFLGRQAVGVFGAAVDVPLPEVLYLIWAALLLGVVGAAIRLGGRRERLVLVATAGAVVLSVFVLAIAVRPTGFPAQARHLLPLALLLPLGAGEVLRRHAAKVSERAARGALLGAVAVAVPVHLAAWYVNARAWSGDPSEPGFLFSDVAYSPPLSWLVWCAALLGAAAAALGATWAATRRSSYG